MASTMVAETLAANLPSYYTELDSLDLSEAVRNFDDAGNLETFNRAVCSAKSQNFFLDFGDDEAWCGFDFDTDVYTSLLKSPRPHSLNTRWINIWHAHEQRDLLTALARHYDFSPRLLGFMCSAPIKTARSMNASKSSSRSSLFNRSSRHSRESPTHPSPDSSSLVQSLDAEEKVGMTELSMSSKSDIALSLNQYALANDIWHYSSVDWGRRYICLGYNTLHNINEARSRNDDQDSFHQDLPGGKRVWTWLLLCDDKTVITINEDPYPYRSGLLTHQEQRNIGVIRRNMINVFRQCSKARDPLTDAAPMQLPIRTRVGDSEAESQHRPSDVPGLLFYYLFDDWITIYDLIARREHRYAAELNQLRLNMLSKAELAHADRLHHIGRQLAVLKRLYKSYDLIIDRLLEKREISLASLKNSNIIHSGAESMAASHLHIAESQSSLGVSLSSPARVRFERLKHSIQLYALTEVQECLDQKDSLVMMNFNLIAIKESYSVERLTRVTLLLAKVTILFMPVSLMTAYFSCQLHDVEFTVASYWSWFAGVFSSSVISLIIFSLISAKMEGQIVSRTTSVRFLEFFGRLFSIGKKMRD